MTSVSLLREVQQNLGFAPTIDEVQVNIFTRFSAPGRKSLSGWLKLFPGGRFAVYGDYRTGSFFRWFAPNGPSSPRRRRLPEVLPGYRRSEPRGLSEDQQAAAASALNIWKRAEPFRAHPYARRKQIQGNSLRELPAGSSGAFRRLQGRLLLVPLLSARGRLLSLQAIDSNGNKQFFPGAGTRGASVVIGGTSITALADATDVYVVEGLATGFAVAAMTNAPVVVAFSAGNLAIVSQDVRRNVPEARIVLAADSDRSGVGERKAREAATLIGASVALLEVPRRWSKDSFDWSDFWLRGGSWPHGSAS